MNGDDSLGEYLTVWNVELKDGPNQDYVVVARFLREEDAREWVWRWDKSRHAVVIQSNEWSQIWGSSALRDLDFDE